MQTSALGQLAEKGIVTIQKKNGQWHVECITKDEAGFLNNRQSKWGSDLQVVIRELAENVSHSR